MAVLLFLSSCGEKGGKIEGSHNYENKQFPITVHVYENKSDLQKALREKGLDNRRNVSGKSSWSITSDMKVLYDCDIYVVKPNGVEDKDNLHTWGHELAHCVYGTYHPE